jgi:flagellar hook protein FlgE
MTISSALNAGVAGLNANASRLASISDNIANSGTYGYKRAWTEFESLVLSGAQNAGSYSAGGVRANASRLIDERGSLVSTASALDLAVSGRGMLPVMRSVNMGGSQGELLMTTTGAFRPDENGVLRTASGLVLLGWPANADGTIPVMPRDAMSGLSPVVVNTNQQAGDPTTAVRLGVNLPATATDESAPGDPLPLSVEYFGNHHLHPDAGHRRALQPMDHDDHRFRARRRGDRGIYAHLRRQPRQWRHTGLGQRCFGWRI